MSMGAGRARKEDAIDPMVGIRLYKELGDAIRPGEPIFTLYGKSDADLPALAQQAADLITVTPEKPVHIDPVVSEIITE